MTALIFFDINGTIIKRDSRTDIPYGKAVDEFLGLENGMEGVDTSARSDKDVFMEVLEKNGQDFFTRPVAGLYENIHQTSGCL